MATPTDYAHPVQSGLRARSPHGRAGRRRHAVCERLARPRPGTLAQGPRPGGARRLPLRPHRADGGPGHPATARVLPGPWAPPRLSHRGLGAARLLRSAAAHARLRRERAATRGATTSTRSSTRCPRAGRGGAEQDHHERVSLQRLRAPGARLGSGAARLHRHLDQLLRRGHRPRRGRSRLPQPARRGRLRRAPASRCTTPPARTSRGCSAACASSAQVLAELQGAPTVAR